MSKIIEWCDLDQIIKHRIAKLGGELMKFPGDLDQKIEELLWIRDEAKSKCKELDKHVAS